MLKLHKLTKSKNTVSQKVLRATFLAHTVYTIWGKKLHQIIFLITLSNLAQF